MAFPSRSLWPVLTIVALLSACAGPGEFSRPPIAADEGDGRLAACLDFYRTFDQAVTTAGVRDAEAHQPSGLPYLRVNRFLASYADRLEPAAFDPWVDAMIALDRDARRVEYANLPEDRRDRLAAEAGDVEGILERCPPLLRAHDFATATGRAALQDAAMVPDDYSLAYRTFGVYPLSAIPIAMGYDRWKRDNLPEFEAPLTADAFGGTPLLYRPGAAAGPKTPTDEAAIAALVEKAPRDGLGRPMPDDEALADLAFHFAPAFLVDRQSEADELGAPVWDEAGRPAVDRNRPTAYFRPAYSWFEGRPVLQLVYQVWFPERPKNGRLDLLGGRLDGLVWRVTLDQAGRVLVYDTIHPCGCYHLFFPANDVVRKPLPEDDVSDIRESIEVPRRAPELDAGERLTVKVAATSHYVSGLAADLPPGLPAEQREYRLLFDPEIPDAALRSLPLPDGGQRSLYGEDGLVAGTERAERWLLWPMGIKSPGAMRQWGRHATAFVGRRHFDEPELFERAFSR
jgi:hypothetical protein